MLARYELDRERCRVTFGQFERIEVERETHRSRDLFALLYFRIYPEPLLPPSWLMDTHDEWPIRLMDLFKAHPAIAPADLGFPANWEADPIWN